MKRLALTTAALTLILAGCGEADDPDVAADRTPATPPTSTPPTSATPTATPTVEPSAGSYPDFGPTSYTYTLVVSCFCIDAGTPMTVTVEDDEVTRAVYATDAPGRGGGREGDPVFQGWWLSIDDIIAEADDAEAAGAAKVQVRWPDGQDHPSRVYIDRSTNTADEEVGYRISGVTVS